MQVADKHTIA